MRKGFLKKLFYTFYYYYICKAVYPSNIRILIYLSIKNLLLNLKIILDINFRIFENIPGNFWFYLILEYLIKLFKKLFGDRRLDKINTLKALWPFRFRKIARSLNRSQKRSDRKRKIPTNKKKRSRIRQNSGEIFLLLCSKHLELFYYFNYLGFVASEIIK